jgi:hypothetical protein
MSLFTYSEGGEAPGYSFLKRFLKALLLELLLAVGAALFTCHSCRSGLACALRAVKCVSQSP